MSRCFEVITSELGLIYSFTTDSIVVQPPSNEVILNTHGRTGSKFYDEGEGKSKDEMRRRVDMK